MADALIEHLDFRVPENLKTQYELPSSGRVVSPTTSSARGTEEQNA